MDDGERIDDPVWFTDGLEIPVEWNPPTPPHGVPEASTPRPAPAASMRLRDELALYAAPPRT